MFCDYSAINQCSNYRGDFPPAGARGDFPPAVAYRTVICIDCSLQTSVSSQPVCERVVACCRKWDAELVDALFPQLLPHLRSNVVRSCDVGWKAAAVRGFVSRFHLQLYHHLNHMLVMLRQMSLVLYLCMQLCVCWYATLCLKKDTELLNITLADVKQCAVERDSLSGQGSTQPGCVRLPKILIIATHMMNRQLIPGRKKRV